ncbi:MAG: hypothetical protein A2233_03715 [Candidatus Kerfeldbacteria bacterium RIFOXYA2_FULL_38_24]|uniref:Uncharacterized protein n=1 Tax=Candidatus Kerfeldbacteria bacterium RIFOXYB2_FULL_38_14 TaxID=1798547 RepID=A0A1G2BAB2_9BACT|nr:MAG: hypothetical protein A2233_03715 [Candidatus Kerfeldbacteria bacterium RIFOXYA2_FULL_38_24]OGY86091.1 MAG: hypothetical protein A2319_01360 [Candidatus Kerfeldbacteria bacterium RIFOXYB2_FULL_38_14]
MSKKNIVLILVVALLLLIGLSLRIYQINHVLFSENEVHYLEASVGLVKTHHFQNWDFIAQKGLKPFYGDRFFTTQVALSHVLFGVSEFTTRLPSFFWSLVLLLAIFCTTYLFTRKWLWAAILLFFAVFFPPFINLARTVDPLGMYVAIAWLGIALILLPCRLSKISGVIILFFGLAQSVRWFGLIGNGIHLDGFLSFFKFICSDLRFKWLTGIPLVYFLFFSAWWQKIPLRWFVGGTLAGLVILGFIIPHFEAHPLVLIFFPFFWLLLLYSIDFLIPKKAVWGLVLAGLVLSVLPSFPKISGFTPLTQDAQADHDALYFNKQDLLQVYEYIEENPLEITHFLRPTKYYLSAYNFNYQGHTGLSKYKRGYLLKYFSKNKTGYLVYPKSAEENMPLVLLQVLQENLTYHTDISTTTSQQVWSWNEQQASDFLKSQPLP